MRYTVFFLLILFVVFSACSHELPSPVTDEGPDNLDRELKLEDFAMPESCAPCHPNHYDEWEGSMHAYAAIDPVFIKMQEHGQKETDKKLDQFCIQCHSPVASKLGHTPAGYKQEDLPPLALKSVSCTSCHSIVSVEEHKNAGAVFDPREGFRGSIPDPVSTPAHKSIYSELFTSSDLCGACHNVVNGRDVIIENTYTEWQSSPAAAAGQQCQDCHMPAYQGQAAVGGPVREVHRHTFVGVDVALIDDFPDREEQARLVTELLRSAAQIDVTAPDSVRAGGFFPLYVTITSLTAGHHLPTGAVADRQMWLAVTITDQATGEIVYQSGHLDANGDLYDRHSEIAPNLDYDLVVFNQQLVGETGDDVFFSWEAFDERTVTIPPLESVTPRYFIRLPDSVQGPLNVTVRLRFRTFPPFLLRMLALDDIAARLPIVDMAEWEGTIAVN